MNIINLAKAAENPIVSCTGNDCGICSLLETISNVYNFFLAVSFAVAVLVLVIAGVNYLLNGGDRNKIQKSLYILKSGIIGFTLIILGWVIIQSVVKTVGYENAGGWWQFQCATENENSALEKQELSLTQADYYKNLKTFPDLTSYLKSGEKTAKISGPADALAFASQIKNLKDGETLHFLAPARIDSTNGAEDLFLPLLSVLKDGENLKLKSTGEYWDLIQNMWPKVSDSVDLDDDASILDKLLGTDSFTDNRSLITEDNADFANLYKTIAETLRGSGDRSETTFGQDDLSNASLSELIALAGSFEQGENPNATDRMIGDLTTQVLGLVSEVVVEKDEMSNSSSTDGWRCTSSGGEWDSSKCSCPDQNILGSDKMCHDLGKLKNNCENSGGEWNDSGESNSTPVCGSSGAISGELSVPAWEQNAERADENDIALSREFCACKDSFCVDSSGACLDNSKDKDGDKIVNGLDVCPVTPSSEKTAVNKDKGGQYYGCSCSEIGKVNEACPPDQCVGDEWVVYPSAEQQCKNGQPSAYSCEPTGRGYNEQCVEQNKLTEGEDTGFGEQNLNSNTNPWATTPSSPFKNSSANSQTPKSANSGNKASAPSKGTPKANSGDKKTGDERLGDPRNPGEGGIASSNNHGSPLGVKAALKRIYQRDKLRYLMVFKYVNYIEPSGGGGLTWSHRGGVIGVNFGLGIKYLDQVIIHEAGHRADFSWNGWSYSTANLESIAVATEAGSVGRIKESPGQKEEVKVTLVPQKDKNDSSNATPTNSDSNERLECRGYEARWLDRDIDPRGDMNPSDIGFAVWYAKSNGGGTPGSNIVYGWPPGGEKYILRVSDYQESRVKIIMDGANKRSCMSRPSDDMPQLTTENGYTEEQLKGCKDARPIKIGG